MGKSTILNLLIPDAGARTREFSEALDLGKQTTTVTCWYDYGEDGAIVDSPGFQEFGLEHLDFDDVILGDAGYPAVCHGWPLLQLPASE